VNSHRTRQTLADLAALVPRIAGEQNEETTVGLLKDDVVGPEERDEQSCDVGSDGFRPPAPRPSREGVEIIELSHQEGGMPGRRRAVQDRTGDVVEDFAGGGESGQGLDREGLTGA